MKMQMFLAALALASTAAGAQQAAVDPSQAYIDSGFAAMDTDKNGQIDRAEFTRFMQARLEKQRASFDDAFAKLDKNGDGKISKAEAAVLQPLAENFAAVDTNSDGAISKDELRAAMLASQAKAAN